MDTLKKIALIAFLLWIGIYILPHVDTHNIKIVDNDRRKVIQPERKIYWDYNERVRSDGITEEIAEVENDDEYVLRIFSRPEGKMLQVMIPRQNCLESTIILLKDYTGNTSGYKISCSKLDNIYAAWYELKFGQNDGGVFEELIKAKQIIIDHGGRGRVVFDTDGNPIKGIRKWTELGLKNSISNYLPILLIGKEIIQEFNSDPKDCMVSFEKLNITSPNGGFVIKRIIKNKAGGFEGVIYREKDAITLSCKAGAGIFYVSKYI